MQKYLVIEEELTQDEIEEGLEPEEFTMLVDFSKHALKRMFDDYGRQVDVEEVMDLLYSKKAITRQSLNVPFTVLRDDHKLAVVCIINCIEKEYVLSIITVVRKTFITPDGFEIEKKVKVSGVVIF